MQHILFCSFIEITPRHGCSSKNLLHIFRTPIPKNTFGGLLLYPEYPEYLFLNKTTQQTFVGLQDVLKTCLEDVLKTYLEDVLKTCLEDIFKTSWKQTNLNVYIFPDIFDLANLHLTNLYLTNLRRIQND